MTVSSVCATTVCFSLSRFTAKERDSESGNDYFGARYYASSMGRFMSPDWSAKVAPVPYAKLGDPQTLNLYTYVGNNPLARIDADGHLTIIVPGTFNNHKEWDNSKFKDQVSKTFGEKAIVLNNNNMQDNSSSRAAAAKQLESLIHDHQFAEGEKLNIVTHSHGGNVADLRLHRRACRTRSTLLLPSAFQFAATTTSMNRQSAST